MYLLAALALDFSVIGVTVWFFFIQSPKMFSLLGRKRFVPVMMQLTKLFFNATAPLVALGAVLSALQLRQLMHPAFLSSLIAATAAAINRGVVVPRALAAGRASVADYSREEDSSAKRDFVVEGGSKTKTKTLHQTVVLFVLVQTGALASHAYFMIN